MKCKNFPGRKNQRRIEALARMLPYRLQSNEAARLERLIVDPTTARAIRTKKRRSL